MTDNDSVVDLSNWMATREPSMTPEQQEETQDLGGTEGLRRALYKMEQMKRQMTEGEPEHDDTDLMVWWREHKTRNQL